MAINPDTRTFIQTRLPSLVGAILLVYFAFHLMQGDKGILTYLSLQSQMHTLEAQEADQKAELAVMENKVSRLRPDTFDRDYAEEQARLTAGLMRSDETMVALDHQ